MLKFLSMLSKHLVRAIPAVMVAGFLFGLAVPAGWLKTLIVPLTFLMVYPMMVSLKLAKVLEGGDSKAQLLAQVINFGIVPFFAFGLGRYFFPEQPYYAMGLLLAALLLREPISLLQGLGASFAVGGMLAAVLFTGRKAE